MESALADGESFDPAALLKKLNPNGGQGELPIQGAPEVTPNGAIEK
jgi:hypothetical protein